MPDLPDLTAKQYAFVQGILSGKTASDAYRAAYDAQGSSNHVVWNEAYLLKQNRDVAVWLSKARTEGLTSAIMTKEAYLQETERLKGVCEGEKNYGAAVKAHELAGKVMGHYEDKANKGLGETLVLADVLSRIQMSQPKMAATLALSLGVDLPDSDKPPAQDDTIQ